MKIKKTKASRTYGVVPEYNVVGGDARAHASAPQGPRNNDVWRGVFVYFTLTAVTGRVTFRIERARARPWNTQTWQGRLKWKNTR